MNLLDMVLQAQGGSVVDQLSRSAGLDRSQTASAVQHLLPALTRAMQANIASGGTDGLIGALSRGRHADYVEHPEHLARPESAQDGNGILSHLLGSKDASRALAKQVAGQTGISEEMLKKLLPLVAATLMGTLSQSTKGGSSGAAGLMGLLTGGGASPAGQALGMLGKFLGR